MTQNEFNEIQLFAIHVYCDINEAKLNLEKIEKQVKNLIQVISKYDQLELFKDEE